jgi:hypothetical protein
MEENEIAQSRLKDAQKKLEETKAALQEAVRTFENKLLKHFEEEKIKESAGLEDWNAPTRDEETEDKREDEFLALHEVESLRQWVSKSVIQVRAVVEMGSACRYP